MRANPSRLIGQSISNAMRFSLQQTTNAQPVCWLIVAAGAQGVSVASESEWILSQWRRLSGKLRVKDRMVRPGTIIG